MKYRTLGRTGIRVSEIGFGTWGIGSGWGSRDDAEAIRALNLAFDQGINFYDTAMAYGSEPMLGKVFADRRDKVVIATKIPPKTSRWPVLDNEPASETFPASWIIECTDKSLKQMGTDYIDVQQFHAWADPYMEQGDWFEGVQKLKKQGKIRAWGVSVNDWDPYNSVRLIESGRCDCVQVIYNAFEQRPAEKLLPAARKHKVGIIVRVPFEEGILTGTIRPGHKFAKGDWRADHLTPQRLKAAEPHIQALEKLLDDTDKDLPTLALRFAMAHPAVSTVIPGMRRCKHVSANTAVSDLPAMGAQKVAQIEALKWDHGWQYPWSQKA